MISQKKYKNGISLRKVNRWLIFGALVICGIVLYSTYRLSLSFKHLTETSEQQIELQKASHELMDASDYLTEKVQRFTISGDIGFLNNYFEEAFNANRREQALSTLASGVGTIAALEKLEAAMDSSLKLMNREYYAMRLVIEAKGYTEYPKILQSIHLSNEDMALSPRDKMHRAAEMVHDEEYYGQKGRIRRNMRDSLFELEQMAYDSNEAALESVGGEVLLMRIIIILQTIVFLVMVWLTSRLGIHPVLNAIESIKEDSPIPGVGAKEFRNLAHTYNKMYDVYQKSFDHLNFKASHDELTGAYNRSGYEVILSNIDLSNTYMMLVDVDNFKTINDTYGHEVGDKILIKLVQVLQKTFRAEDYICRIGGDEFVIIMVNSTETQLKQIEPRIKAINRELDETEDGLPPVSISVGIAYGGAATDIEDLFEKTDMAMYMAKHNGKHTYKVFKD